MVAFDGPAAGNRFTRQHAIDVGDVPGHELRVFELVRTYAPGAATIEGFSLREAWIRGMTDFTDLNGLGTSYVTYTLDNGDRIYARGNFIAHRLPAGGQPAPALKNMTELTITGGTGCFLAIRGIVRGETVSDNATFNQNRTEMEYWMEAPQACDRSISPEA